VKTRHLTAKHQAPQGLAARVWAGVAFTMALPQSGAAVLAAGPAFDLASLERREGQTYPGETSV